MNLINWRWRKGKVLEIYLPFLLLLLLMTVLLTGTRLYYLAVATFITNIVITGF